MSASTVSTTAVVKRRMGVPVEKDGQEIDGPAAKVYGADGLSYTWEDVRHSFSTEAIAEKRNESLRRTLGNSAVANRRSKKASGMSGKPRCSSVLIFFIKILLLVLLGTGFVLLIRKTSINPATMMGVSEFDDQVEEVEEFANKMANAMKIQLEVIEKKVESRVEKTRKELEWKVEEMAADLTNQINALGTRNQWVVKVVDDLRKLDGLTRQEFESVYTELNNVNGGERRRCSVEDVRITAKEIVCREIERHASDGLGMVDYALAAGGGAVTRHSEAIQKRFSYTGMKGVHKDAWKMLSPGFGEPGQCFPLKGSNGFVEVKLRTAIVPTAITLEHVAQSSGYDRSSAPRECLVSGWMRGENVDAPAAKRYRLAEFRYELEERYAQTQRVSEMAAPTSIDTVRLDVLSNHGNPSFTCIYRLRVHGHEPVYASMSAIEM